MVAEAVTRSQCQPTGDMPSIQRNNIAPGSTFNWTVWMLDLQNVTPNTPTGDPAAFDVNGLKLGFMLGGVIASGTETGPNVVACNQKNTSLRYPYIMVEPAAVVGACEPIG